MGPLLLLLLLPLLLGLLHPRRSLHARLIHRGLHSKGRARGGARLLNRVGSALALSQSEHAQHVWWKSGGIGDTLRST